VIVTSDVTDVVSAVRARDRFLATMSHEFRTPLGNILGYTEMVLEEPGLSPSSRSDLQVVARNAEHVNQMVEDILAASVTGTDAPKVRLPLDFAEVIREAVDSSRAEAVRRRIALTAEVPSVLRVLGDRTGLVRVLDNLVSNALKYSAPGTSVRLAGSREGAWAVCRVEDSGIGIAVDELEHVFTRFGRGRTALDLDVPGTGLGLSLAKEVVEQHGGTIECTSQIGTGSTFTVRLPLRGEGVADHLTPGPGPSHAQHV
jgi:signal transduction histidine kinase